MVTAVLTASAVPPELALAPSEEDAAPAPPRPTIYPAFTSSRPPGKEPLIVIAGVPVLVALTYIPEFIVTTTLLDSFHPAAIANARKLTSD
jgi:hypothetical protein